MKHRLILLCLLLLPASGLLGGIETETTPGYTLTGEDVELSIKVVKQPVFPHILKLEGFSKGQVSLLLEISYEGELLDWLVYRADHKRFVGAVEAVIADWKFSQPSRNGNPISVIARVDVNFESTGDIVSLDHFGAFQQMTKFNERYSPHAVGIAAVAQLDAPPSAIHVAPPLIAQSLLDKHGSGICVFKFFIDTEGNVRLPHLSKVEGYVDDRLILAAQDALAQWRFVPPTIGGRAVVVEVSQPFHFEKTAKSK